MNNLEQEYTQPLGLDVGTSRVVVARAKDKKQEYESQLNAFMTMPYSKLAESLLQRENVFHEVHGADIIVAGDDAEKFAEVFHVETRRPMARGVLNPDEPHSLAVVRRLITKLVGRAAAEGQKVFFSVPAQGETLNGSIRYHEASIRQILADLGYEAIPIEEGLAVVYGELAASNYSGVAISCGSGLCNVCLAVLSVPVISFSVPKAGDFIDANAAQVTGDRANRLRISKEKNFQLNGFTGDRVHNALTVYYQEVIGSLIGSLRSHIASAQKLPKLEQSVPLVLSGGTTMPKGFLDHFMRILQAEEFPLRLSEVRVSGDPLHSTARGALMAAQC
jgi:actin-like ATPase involved in cell morphogenesis